MLSMLYQRVILFSDAYRMKSRACNPLFGLRSLDTWLLLGHLKQIKEMSSMYIRQAVLDLSILFNVKDQQL